MDLTVRPVDRLAGRLRVVADKSISHRAALIGALADGEAAIENFLASDDCLSTLACLRALGVAVDRRGGTVRVRGSGMCLRAPSEVLDAGNSGTTIRLLTGILAAQPFVAEITGDASLRRRPMDRVIQPLRQMGARIEALGEGGCPPLRITGGSLRGITYTLPVASAQVKSAVLLAGMQAAGATTVVEPLPSRDHTERMLRWFGAAVRREGDRITVAASPLRARPVAVPGDISSAAFFLTAAAALPDSEVTVEAVGVNPTRTGVLDVLRTMGAAVEMRNVAEQCGEPVGDIVVRGTRLRGVRIAGAVIPRVIDELPVLCVAAAAATGVTTIADAAELRVKESDRIGVMARSLRALGVEVHEHPDGMTIHGGRLRSGTVDSSGDHRMAMAFAVAGLLADGPVTVTGAESIAVSFPGFSDVLRDISTGRVGGRP